MKSEKLQKPIVPLLEDKYFIEATKSLNSNFYGLTIYRKNSENKLEEVAAVASKKYILTSDYYLHQLARKLVSLKIYTKKEQAYHDILTNTPLLKKLLNDWVEAEEEAIEYIKNKIPKEWDDEEEEIAKDKLKNEDILDFVVKTAQHNHIGDKPQLQINFISGHTTQTKDQLHLMSIGRTEKGKTDVSETALEFFPRYYTISLTEFSELNLYYATQDTDFNNKIIYIDDVEQKHISLLKTITSKNKNKPEHWSVKDQEHVKLRIEGDFVVWVTCVTPLQDEQGQITSRFLLTNPDESETQDKKVVKHIKDRKRLGFTKKQLHPDFKLIKAMSFILKQEENIISVIPFDFEFPHKNQRRNIDLFTALLRGVTSVYRFQRPHIKLKDDSKILFSTFYDFNKAKELWDSIIALQFQKVSDLALKILKLLPNEEPKEPTFDIVDNKKIEVPQDTPTTKTSIANELNLPPSTVNDKLYELYKAGLVDYKRWKTKGNPNAWWKASYLTATDNLTSLVKIKNFTLTELKEFLFLLTEKYGVINDIYSSDEALTRLYSCISSSKSPLVKTNTQNHTENPDNEEITNGDTNTLAVNEDIEDSDKDDIEPDEDEWY